MLNYKCVCYEGKREDYCKARVHDLFAPSPSSAASKSEYCTTIEEAGAAGWLSPYEGGTPATKWKGRIYGRKPGNHRIFRCTKWQSFPKGPEVRA